MSRSTRLIGKRRKRTSFEMLETEIAASHAVGKAIFPFVSNETTQARLGRKMVLGQKIDGVTECRNDKS
ncbi:MAG: hypothetical protein VXW22_12720 [Pseudomonadota bacterium]|nr:hypothetical protein [Pseudomonadota bacterium]